MKSIKAVIGNRNIWVTEVRNFPRFYLYKFTRGILIGFCSSTQELSPVQRQLKMNKSLS
jgi:hypothetical protein